MHSTQRRRLLSRSRSHDNTDRLLNALKDARIDFGLVAPLESSRLPDVITCLTQVGAHLLKAWTV